MAFGPVERRAMAVFSAGRHFTLESAVVIRPGAACVLENRVDGMEAFGPKIKTRIWRGRCWRTNAINDREAYRGSGCIPRHDAPAPIAGEKVVVPFAVMDN